MDASETVDAPTTPNDHPLARRNVRPLLLVAAVGLLVLVGIVGVAVLRPEPAVRDAAATGGPPQLGDADRAVGRPLPRAVLPPLADLGPDGGLELPTDSGEPMVINFWATWCAPCVDEMPMLQRVADDLDVTVVGVDYLDQADKAVALARELGISYTLVRDREGTFGQEIGLLGTPTTLLVDDEGIVRRRLTGELSEQQLRAAIAEDLG